MNDKVRELISQAMELLEEAIGNVDSDNLESDETYLAIRKSLSWLDTIMD